MQELETERLILRNFQKQDFDDYSELIKMKNVNIRMGINKEFSCDEIEERFNKVLKDNFCYAIELRDNSKVIGQVNITAHEGNAEVLGIEPIKACNVNYCINERYWGRGFATEAMEEILKFIFSKLNKEIVFAGYFDKNISSGRVLEKCGFEIWGKIKNAKIWFEDDQPTDLIWTKLCKEKFIIQ